MTQTMVSPKVKSGSLESSISQSVNLMLDDGWHIAQNAILDRQKFTVCPMGAMMVRFDTFYPLPKSMVIGYMDGFDGKSPVYTWACDKSMYDSGYSLGRSHREKNL